ncbi:MAG TPA: cell division protein FtsQ/DivIB [Solirubrobacterales bacterium]|nr:cell division protein FtsQ/DivIB [Solirubrobacterales bacterium]
MKRWRWPAAIALAAIAFLFAVYMLVLRDEAVTPDVSAPEVTATIGSGSDAIAVAADGTLLPWLALPEEASLPMLPLAEPPKSGRLAGPVLQQALVFGAAPAALRPYLERSYYGESGVDVVLDGGIELRFGDASQAARKWKAAAAVLADPEISTLDYVDLHAPSRPAVYGSSHTLPALP